MSESTTRRFTPSATLAAIGAKLRSLDLLDPIHQHVVIAQKTVTHSPVDKITDALVAILAGAHGMVEINTRVRSDPVLQRAFGRTGCAEQSVVQRTFNACTADNVKQMRFACDVIVQHRSRACRHPFAKSLLLLDVDITAMLCGRQAELATKGYFADHPTNARGRQLGRVTASDYGEIAADFLFAGNLQLRDVYQILILGAERALVLNEDRRARTVLRIDAGGGSLDAVNWLLERGYHILCKDISSARAEALATSVVEWYDDPRHPGRRQVGWVGCDAEEYVRPVRRLAVRARAENGPWEYAADITTLLPHQARQLAGVSLDEMKGRAGEALSYAWAYDKRGGGVETAFKEDKQGLGIRKRNKKRAAAQEMVMLVNQLAHNILRWARGWLEHHAPQLARFGLLRWVRDLLHTSGVLVFDRQKRLVRIVLNKAAPYARGLAGPLMGLLAGEQIGVELGSM